jgi:hypothetical protein
LRLADTLPANLEYLNSSALGQSEAHESETAPSGPQWLHEIKLDGFRMAVRVERGNARLLTRTGLDWSDKYPSVVAALAKVRAKAAYLDVELRRWRRWLAKFLPNSGREPWRARRSAGLLRLRSPASRPSGHSQSASPLALGRPLVGMNRRHVRARRYR